MKFIKIIALVIVCLLFSEFAKATTFAQAKNYAITYKKQIIGACVFIGVFAHYFFSRSKQKNSNTVKKLNDKQIQEIAYKIEEIRKSIRNREEMWYSIGNFAVVDVTEQEEELEKLVQEYRDYNITDAQSILNEINSLYDTEILRSQRLLHLIYKHPSKNKYQQEHKIYLSFLRQPRTTALQIRT
jgi:hypothetical protein